MISPDQFIRHCQSAGCPADQIKNFINAGIILQAKQLAASAAARLCDKPDGPTAIGYGGARAGGKSHWLLSQIGGDDCQRYPGLKCLLLRKVGKSNLEHFEDLAQRLFHSLPHEFNSSRGILTFANGSRIVLGHYQHEKEISKYLGLEYDVIGIDEATQLSAVKFTDISTCCRTSKPDWRPRIYTATNPGGLGHQWYLDKFIVPYKSKTETATRFIPARMEDNAFINPENKAEIASLTGWKRNAWGNGEWDIPAGQYFKTFRPDIHIIGGDENSLSSFGGESSREEANTPFFDNLARLRRFKECDAVNWVASMDYGFTHYSVVLLGCLDHADNLYIIDEHAERFWVPQRHAQAIKQMLARHQVYSTEDHAKEDVLARFPNYSREQEHAWRQSKKRRLAHFPAGTDMFGSESNGASVASEYRKLGINLRPANMDRVSGWSAIQQRLGDPEAGILPSLFIHKRCTHLLETLPYLQYDPERAGDILKINTNEEGTGGDDAADALRYMVATRRNVCHVMKLRGL
ncbi:MAG: terminase large subunit domain-containing protein [Limisphaerales bacterium]